MTRLRYRPGAGWFTPIKLPGFRTYWIGPLPSYEAALEQARILFWQHPVTRAA
jgi:hypothetical protein